MRGLSVASIAGMVALAWISSSFGAPRVEVHDGTVMVAGDGYRARFVPEAAGFNLDIRDAGGRWQPVAADTAGTTLGIFADREYPAGGRRATWALRHDADAVVVGQQMVLDAQCRLVLELHCCCTDRGLLLGARLIGPPAPAVPAGCGRRRGFVWTQHVGSDINSGMPKAAVTRAASRRRSVSGLRRHFAVEQRGHGRRTRCPATGADHPWRRAPRRRGTRGATPVTQ